MSLLDDVSIVVTPNGYKAGTLYGVLPTATLGSDQVINGDFATDTDWTKAANWTISGGKVISNGSGLIYQTGVTYLDDKQYKVTFNADITSGNFTVRIGNTSSGIVVTQGFNTHYLSRIPSNTTGFLFFQAISGVGSIDNVSVKEWTASDMDVTRATAATRVDEDGLVNYAEIITGSNIITDGDFPNGSTAWALNGWTISDNAANCSGITANMIQNISGSTNKTYSLTFTISNYVSGSVIPAFVGGNTYSKVYNANGTFTEVISSYSDIRFVFYATSFDGSVSNVSVKEVTRDNVPRIDYTGGCPHILAEPQRTNLVTDSESYTGYFSNSGTLIYNNTTSPDGLENGAKNYASTTGSYKGLSKSFGSTLNNSAYTLSIFAKKGEFDNLFFYNIGSPSGNGGVWFNLSTGSVGTTHASWSNAKMEDLGNGWYRCSSTVTLSGTSDNLYILLSDADNSVTATASGTDGYYIYGAQLEEGSYPTSYIPTSGSTVTRNQDTFTRDGIGSLINSTEGVLFVEMAALSDDGTIRSITLNDSTNTNRVYIGFESFQRIQFNVKSSGSTIFNYYEVVSDITVNSKLAIKYKANDFSVWLDGVKITSQLSGVIPIGLNKLSFDDGNSSSPLFGKVRQLQVYNTALTDEQLLQLTGESGTDFYESYAEMAAALTYTIQ